MSLSEIKERLDTFRSLGIVREWPKPEPLGGELPPVRACDLALLPESLRPLVEDTAERMQVPLDFPAVTAVLCLAGATNRRATIQPKAADTSWIVVPNLWGGIIASPGLMKSAVISIATQPLTRIEAGWRADYESAVTKYRQQQEEAALRQAAWREVYKAAHKGGKRVPVRPDDQMSEPVCGRLITQDATAEKLHEILRDNPAGILVIRDELSGWVATLDKPGREGERGFFLSAWNGDTPYTIDRIGRGSIYVEACCVSIIGGIQPARLRNYLADALQRRPAERWFTPAVPSAGVSRHPQELAVRGSCATTGSNLSRTAGVRQAGPHGSNKVAKVPLRSGGPTAFRGLVDKLGGCQVAP